jgi:hypothetical protein
MLRTLVFSIWFLMHPVHVTLTSIEYVPEADSFKVFLRLYFDDFIRDCKLSGTDIIEKDFLTANAKSLSQLEDYLKGKVIIKVNNKELYGRVQTMNLADNELSINLKYGESRKPKTVTVRNLIMTGLYGDMSNMIMVKINDFEEGVKLTSDMTEQTFKIK